jgi:hypothetical protein
MELSMSLALVGIVKRANMIDLKFGEGADDPVPFIPAMPPQYVAQQTSGFADKWPGR